MTNDDELKFPDMKSVTFNSPEDAKLMAEIFNEIYEKLRELDYRVRELEGGNFN